MAITASFAPETGQTPQNLYAQRVRGLFYWLYSAGITMPESKVFADFDFTALRKKDFKEDAVREEIVLPLLRALGYRSSGAAKITRSKTLDHPFIVIGAKKRKIRLYPDYTIEVGKIVAFVLDAKAPNEDIHQGQNVEQAFSYAIHPDVRTSLFALCNGHELVVYHISEQQPLLTVALSEIDQHWERVSSLLAPEAFHPRPMTAKPRPASTSSSFDYLAAKPPLEIPAVNRQVAKRHFGVHAYFTKQHWAVVQEYIKAFTQPGDLVLDPFGGGGSTLVEALLLERRAIHVDLNPLSHFLVTTLVEPVDAAELTKAFHKVARQFKRKAPHTPDEITEALRKYPYPRGVSLPKNSDVDTVDQLFSPKQLAQLAYLKHLIKRVPTTDSTRNTLLLMFSGLLTKINLTYHASAGRSEGRGDASAFKYYRYRLAPAPADPDVLKYFRSRFTKVLAGKQEISRRVTAERIQSDAMIVNGSATKLDWIKAESVDYIYTDPPYGAKIAYLDLSLMWTAWLDLPISAAQYAQEAIEGGEQKKTREEYSQLIADSLREMARVLKFDHWMSFVFAHQTPAYWHMIIEAAENAGFEYAGAMKQKTGQVSFKKRQNPFTVLSGQLIINFRKVKNPRTIAKVALGAPIMDVVLNNIEAVIAQHDGATIEQINDELVIRGLEMGFLDVLAEQYSDLTPLLQEMFEYDEEGSRYFIKKDTKFKTAVPLQLRVRYFVVSFLRRLEAKNEYPTVDEIVLHVMPLLKNGVTPPAHTILSVLEEVAERVGTGRWRLQKSGQFSLFG